MKKLVSACVISAGFSFAHALEIDPFQDPPQSYRVGTVRNFFEQVDSKSVLGTHRTVISGLENVAGGIGGGFDIAPEERGGGSQFGALTLYGADNAFLMTSLMYGYASTNQYPLTPKDLMVDSSQFSGFEMYEYTSDTSMTVNVRIFSKELGILTRHSAQYVIPAAPQTINVSMNFNDFSPSAALGEIEQIHFEFVAAPGSHTTIDGIRFVDTLGPVPEPGTIVALGLGLAAMARRRRR